MVDKFRSQRRGHDFPAALANILDAAAASLAVENAAEIERLARAISALAAARRALSELVQGAAATASEDDEEHSRAELRRRIARFVETGLAGAPAEVLERIGSEGAAP